MISEAKGKNTLIGLVLIVFVYLYVRMESYLTVAGTSEMLLLGLRGIITAYAALLILNARVIKVRYSMGPAILFWLISIGTNAYVSQSLSNVILNILNQSWFILIYLCFALYFPSLDLDTEKKIVNIGAVFCILYMIRYAVWLFSDNRYWSAGGINAIYYFLLVMPLMHLHKKPMVKTGVFILAAILTIVSGKRAAFIVFSVIVLVPFLLPEKSLYRKKGNAWSIMIVMLGAVVLFFVMQRISTRYDITLFDRFSTMEEDGGSGRLTTYELVLQAFSKSTFFEQFFGHGYNAVALDAVSKSSAHNDILEVLYDYGILGVVFYISFLLSIILRAFYLRKIGSRYYVAYTSSVITYLVMTMVSHLIIYPTYIVFLLMTIALGCMQDELSISDRRRVS